MVIPREPRPRPVPLTPEEAAEIEAKYDELSELVRRMTADYEEREAGSSCSPPGELAARRAD